MNRLIFNITINLEHETKTAEQMAEELEQYGLVEVIQAAIASNPNAIYVGALRESASNQIKDLYNNTELNIWAAEGE